MKKLVETLKEEVRSFTTTEYSDIFNNEDWDLMDFDESPTTTTTTASQQSNNNTTYHHCSASTRTTAAAKKPTYVKPSSTQLQVSYNAGFNPTTQQNNHHQYKTPTYSNKRNPYEKNILQILSLLCILSSQMQVLLYLK